MADTVTLTLTAYNRLRDANTNLALEVVEHYENLYKALEEQVKALDENLER